MNRITRTGARWQWMALMAAAALGLQARAQRNFSGTVETDPEKNCDPALRESTHD